MKLGLSVWRIWSNGANSISPIRQKDLEPVNRWEPLSRRKRNVARGVHMVCLTQCLSEGYSFPLNDEEPTY
jgi:hypothetical protein